MAALLDAPRGPYDRISIPTIWIAFALSLLLHAMALLGWLPILPSQPFEDLKPGKPRGSLAVRLAPVPALAARAAPPSPPVVRTPPAVRRDPGALKPAPRLPPRLPAQPPRAAPKVLAMESPAPQTVAPPRAEPERTPATTDLAAYIAARRAARAPDARPPAQGSSPQPPAESEQERHNRAVAENLGLNRTPGFGADRLPGGGIFQIQRLNYTEAEFIFFGWNKEIRRNSQQIIEVRRGDNPSIELAVVRRMIAIIREHAKDDFLWESVRLNRDVTLSSRPADRAELEAFLMREFFPPAR